MKKRIIGIAKLSVSAILIAYLYSIVDFDTILARLRSAKLTFISIAFVLLVSQIAISTLKWKLILRADGLNTPYLRLLRVYYIGNFLSLFLPSSFGGDVYRVYALGANNKSFGKTTSSVLFDRLSGLGALLTIALIGYISATDGQYTLFLILLYLSGIGFFYMLTSQRAVAKSQGSSVRLVQKASILIASFRTYRLDFKLLCQVFAISLIFQFMVVFINRIYTLSLSIDIPFSELLVIIPLVYLTEILPISINGIGVRDSAFVFFFAAMDYTKEDGLAMALLVLSMRYVSGLVGGLVLLGSVIRQHFLVRESAP